MQTFFTESNGQFEKSGQTFDLRFERYWLAAWNRFQQGSWEDEQLHKRGIEISTATLSSNALAKSDFLAKILNDSNFLQSYNWLLIILKEQNSFVQKSLFHVKSHKHHFPKIQWFDQANMSSNNCYNVHTGGDFNCAVLTFNYFLTLKKTVI